MNLKCVQVPKEYMDDGHEDGAGGCQRGAVGAAGGAEGEEVLERRQVPSDVRYELRRLVRRRGGEALVRGHLMGRKDCELGKQAATAVAMSPDPRSDYSIGGLN